MVKLGASLFQNFGLFQTLLHQIFSTKQHKISKLALLSRFPAKKHSRKVFNPNQKLTDRKLKSPDANRESGPFSGVSLRHSANSDESGSK